MGNILLEIGLFVRSLCIKLDILPDWAQYFMLIDFQDQKFFLLLVSGMDPVWAKKTGAAALYLTQMEIFFYIFSIYMNILESFKSLFFGLHSFGVRHPL